MVSELPITWTQTVGGRRVAGLVPPKSELPKGDQNTRNSQVVVRVSVQIAEPDSRARRDTAESQSCMVGISIIGHARKHYVGKSQSLAVAQCEADSTPLLPAGVLSKLAYTRCVANETATDQNHA